MFTVSWHVISSLGGTGHIFSFSLVPFGFAYKIREIIEHKTETQDPIKKSRINK